MNIKPLFEDLNNPATYKNHFEQLKSSNKATPHTDIFNQLIEQFEPLDFEVLAFPQAEKLREQMEKAAPGSEQAKEIQKQLDKLK
jgi:putative DNA primase/helicase